MSRRFVITTATCLAMALSGPIAAFAQGAPCQPGKGGACAAQPGQKGPGGHKPQQQAKGGPSHGGPQPGDRLQQGGFKPVDNPGKYHLPPPGKGYRYVRKDDQILKIATDTLAVVAVGGVISQLLKSN